MYILYFLALVPVIVGAILVTLKLEINWYEWGIGTALAFVTAGIFHSVIFFSQVGDKETWSGQIVQARYYTAWKEYYEYAVYRTETRRGTRSVSNGKGGTRSESYTYTVRVFDHWQPTTRWHSPSWKAFSNISTSHDIPEGKYKFLVLKFENESSTPGDRQTGEHNSRMIEGDPNDRVTSNIGNKWVEPINDSRFFQNRVKATKNIFNFVKVTEQEAKTLLPYPEHYNAWMSHRLMGTHKNITPLQWEQINARLGPIKFINLICVGYTTPDSGQADKQIALWKGGKKNDFIIFYGPGWSKVYSWSDSELAKQNVMTLFLTPDDPELLDKLYSEIVKNYKIVDWHKFDYLGVEPTTGHIICYIVILFITQICIYVVFHFNDII